MVVAVETPVFKGPFDLLLHLILSEEVDLYEVPLAGIVDAYLAEIERMESLALEPATQFLLIAATLVELKSRRLLPDDAPNDVDDELALWEERDLLLARLLEAKTFKDAARALRARMEAAARRFPRHVGPDERFADLLPDLLAGVSTDDLAAAAGRALAPRPVPSVDRSHVQAPAASVTEAVSDLCRRLPGGGPVTFRDLTADLTTKLDIVVRFLAVLELFKQSLVDLHQTENFGELTVRWIGPTAADGDAAAELVDAYDG